MPANTGYGTKKKSGKGPKRPTSKAHQKGKLKSKVKPAVNRKPRKGGAK